MFDRHAIQQDFGVSAQRYDAHAHLQRQVRAQCVALAATHWPAQALVLDVGCGTGALHREALQWYSIALDLSYGMCHFALQKGARVVQADAAALPFPQASMDGVFSSLMLQWSNDPQAVLLEMSRVLKPNGSAVLATLTDGTLGELRDAFSRVDDAPHVSRFHAAARWEALARQADFDVILAQEELKIETYPDMLSLMRGLKHIGAGNKHQERRRSMMTPRQFAQAEQRYRNDHGDAAGLRATWNILYLLLKKI